MDIVSNLLVFVICCFGMWVASSLTLNNVTKLAAKLNISTFAISFFILGFLTSIPEFSIGINSIIDNEPSIFVGNLIGGSFILFILIMPLFAILAGEVDLNHQLSKKTLVYSLLLVMIPATLILNGEIQQKSGVLMIGLHLFLILLFPKKKPFREMLRDMIRTNKRDNAQALAYIIIGSTITFFIAGVLVQAVENLTLLFNMKPFLLSLILLPIGSNLPEIFLGIRSIMANEKAIAFGNYIGSATANTFIFGLLTLLNGSFIIEGSGFIDIFMLLLMGLVLFYFFSRSNDKLSRSEGSILIFIYFIFLAIEVL